MTFFTADDKGYLLKIKLTPNSAQNGFKGVFCDEKGNVFLKGTVTVVPERGKANKELIALLAKTLKIAKSKIKIISGETDHFKKIYIETTPSLDFSNKLAALTKE